jgi:KRAB domain-containing zinc finger protein
MTHLVEQKVFFCDLCLTAFSRKKNFEIHLKIHSKQKPFKCGECPACFKIKDELVLHMQVHAGRNSKLPLPPGVNNLNGLEVSITTPPLPKLVPLPVSLKIPNPNPNPAQGLSTVPDASNIKVERVDVSRMTLPKLIPSVSISVLGKGKRGRKKNPNRRFAFACEICGHTFSRNHHLQRHKLIHTGERPFRCEHCDKSFSRKERLNAHLVKDHFQGQALLGHPEGTGTAFGDEIVGL